MTSDSSSIDEEKAARFLAEACHELRTPVAVISMFLGLVENPAAAGPERVADFVSRIRRQTDHLSVLLDRYLEHGRLSFAPPPEGFQPLEVSGVVGEAVENLHPLVPPERIRSKLQPGWIMGDAAALHSIVDNLVLNAAKYSAADAPVVVKVDTTTAEVRLQVLDRGIGIPADERETVASPFVRGSNATEIARAGAGLGLAIVNRHAESLGGKLRLRPRRGGGTMATVSLPRLDEVPS